MAETNGNAALSSDSEHALEENRSNVTKNNDAAPKKINFEDVGQLLGAGPMRFAPLGERPVSEQISTLQTSELKCFVILKDNWEKKHPSNHLTDEWYLRFARCSPGTKKFNEKTAWKVMRNFNTRYLTLSASKLEKQIATKTLFPVPGLMTKGGHDVVYMRPSRFFPRQTSTQQILDNLAYCMNTMMEREKACAEGIGFVAYMNDCTAKNFQVGYFLQFMRLLRGRIPVRVRLFLVVNPPKWFAGAWKMIKPVLAPDFRKKVHVIQEPELASFLAPGFESYLPDDTETGTAPTDAMVNDFVTLRKHIEPKDLEKVETPSDADVDSITVDTANASIEDEAIVFSGPSADSPVEKKAESPAES